MSEKLLKQLDFFIGKGEKTMKKVKFVFIIITLFASICYAEIKNRYGYSISAVKRYDNKRYGTEYYNQYDCDIRLAVADGEIACLVLSSGVEFIFAENKYFSWQKNWNDAHIKYFYILNLGAFEWSGDPSNYKKFAFRVDSELDKYYLSIDNLSNFPILPYTEACGTYYITSCALELQYGWSARAEYLFRKIVGKKTGIKKTYTKKQIMEAGKKLRQAPLENWKKEPTCYGILKNGMINYWNKRKNDSNKLNNEVIEWIAKIVKYDNLSGYDDLLEYNEKIKNLSKNTEIAIETKEQETSYQEHEEQQKEKPSRQTWENLSKFLWYGSYASHVPLEKGDKISIPEYLISIVDVDVVNGNYSYLFTSTGISEISQYAYIITKRQLASIRNLVTEPVVIQCEGTASYKRGLSIVDTYVFTLVE